MIWSLRGAGRLAFREPAARRMPGGSLTLHDGQDGAARAGRRCEAIVGAGHDD